MKCGSCVLSNKKCGSCASNKKCGSSASNKKCRSYASNKKCGSSASNKKCRSYASNKKCGSCTSNKKCGSCACNKKWRSCASNNKYGSCASNKKYGSCQSNKKSGSCASNKKWGSCVCCKKYGLWPTNSRSGRIRNLSGHFCGTFKKMLWQKGITGTYFNYYLQIGVSKSKRPVNYESTRSGSTTLAGWYRIFTSCKSSIKPILTLRSPWRAGRLLSGPPGSGSRRSRRCRGSTPAPQGGSGSRQTTSLPP